jgi:alcohol dehydrogenase, propanol-preferring
MRAMLLDQPVSATPKGPWRPLELRDIPAPVPGDGELLVRVDVCGVCRTDLDLAEGRLIAPHYPLVPGHQVVGRVVGLGKGATGFREGDRVGIAWINSADGICEFCRTGTENLCPNFRSTGCDVNGGYAELLTVPAAFAHAIPSDASDVETAPLLCAGAIGWRALGLTNIREATPLGLTGFGASAHLVLQFALRRFPKSPVFVFARKRTEREFALSLGASWAGDTTDAPPEKLGAAIDTTPAWTPVLCALQAMQPGGRIVINAIRKDDRFKNELLKLDYEKQLWMEREIKSAANVTRRDVRECLAAAAEWGIRPTAKELPLEGANEALDAMRTGTVGRGALVLRV